MAASVSTEARTGPSSTARPPNASQETRGDASLNPPATGPVIADGGPRNAPANNTAPQGGEAMNGPGQSLAAVDKLAERVGDLDLQRKSPEVSADTDGTSVRIERPQPVSRESGASDESQKADSSSELGTKPPSLDGKSITSGTTFALDEKESLRPDDSASVKAAGEDDDSFSVRGSLIAGSRIGSDLAARARGIQLGDMPDRRLMQVTPGSSGHGILTPQSTSSEQPSRNGPEMPPLATAEGSANALNLIYRHAPDEKLIEALATPKDRIYLLRLEKEVINFVQNSGYDRPASSLKRTRTYRI